jgi:AcrR family transcriptional regulator
LKRALSDQEKSARRQALLNAALDEFFARGFYAASMEAIARQAGLSKGTLYLYFESKEALFTGLIRSVAVPNVEQIEQLLTRAPTVRDAITRFCEFAPRVIRDTQFPRLVKILIADGPAFPEVISYYRKQIIERGLAALTELLRRGREKGEINIINPELMARLFIAPIILSAIWQVVFEDEEQTTVDLDTLFRMHGEMLLAGLGLAYDSRARR